MSGAVGNGGCGSALEQSDCVRIAHAARLLCLVAVLSSPFASCAAASGAPEAEAAQVAHAVERHMEAMECEDRARRLNLFARAEQLFRQIIEGDEEHAPVRNPDLYVNMGNAALQAERLGPAVFAYRRALRLAPRHAQASQNLAYARSLLPDWVGYDDTHSLLGSLFFWRSLLTVGQIEIWAAFVFLLAAGLVALSILTSQSLWRNLAVVPITVWAVMLSSLVLNPSRSVPRNAVVVQESRIYTADSTNSPPRLSKPVPSGAELTLIQQRGRWTELRLPDGRTGWVRSPAVRRLDDARKS